MLIEPSDAVLPKTPGTRSVDAKIFGQFSGEGNTVGVRGIYFDNENELINGAIIGGRD